MIVKTIVSVQPVLAHNYHSVLPPETNDGYSCFEILGGGRHARRKLEVSSIHWFPYDRVGVVNADP